MAHIILMKIAGLQ